MSLRHRHEARLAVLPAEELAVAEAPLHAEELAVAEAPLHAEELAVAEVPLHAEELVVVEPNAPRGLTRQEPKLWHAAQPL